MFWKELKPGKSKNDFDKKVRSKLMQELLLRFSVSARVPPDDQDSFTCGSSEKVLVVVWSLCADGGEQEETADRLSGCATAAQTSTCPRHAFPASAQELIRERGEQSQ